MTAVYMSFLKTQLSAPSGEIQKTLKVYVLTNIILKNYITLLYSLFNILLK